MAAAANETTLRRRLVLAARSKKGRLRLRGFCAVVPRPMGRGLKSNLRFLPLLYLTGLQNCKISFAGPSSRSRWFSRSKALMRALNNIQSRNTIAKSRGVKVDVLVAPGDSWTHWPDR